jgi:antirestriction protein ArdC
VDGTLQHLEYIANWLQTLRNDERAIFQAASRARQACDYLYGVTGWDDSMGRSDGQGDGSERDRPTVAG